MFVQFNRKLLKKVMVSLGTVLNCRPFFVTYATDRELSLCMCKICLNSKLLFEVLMAKVKKDGDVAYDSLSSFYMHECTCTEAPNGYYQWNCCS